MAFEAVGILFNKHMVLTFARQYFKCFKNDKSLNSHNSMK